MISRRQILMALAAVGVGGCNRSDSARVLYSSDHHPAHYPTVQAVRKMGDILREQTSGRLNIRVYPGGQLGSERDTLEIAIFGGLDLNRVNIAPLNSLAPLTIVPCLPFLFRDEEHMRRALDAEPGNTILASLEPHGLIGLCYYDSGSRSFYNTRAPIRSPDDMAGMKIRVQNSDLYVSMISALGADATPMYLGEVYQSLVQGVIDAAENNWPSYESGRHFEVARYYTLTRHVMAPEVLVMSAHRWRSLTDADKQLVMDAARASVPYMRELWDTRVREARETVLGAGIEMNEVDNIADFSDRMRPVWKRFATSAQQQELIEQIEHMGTAS